MQYSEQELEKLIREVVTNTLKQSTPASKHDDNKFSSSDGIFDNINDAIEAAFSAQIILQRDYSLEDRSRFIKAIKNFSLEEKTKLARMIVEETNLGNYEDKVLKHELAARTAGVEDLEQYVKTGDTGLALTEMAPFGVIGATTPVTNPTETIISNGIAMLAAGNTIVFNVHPSSKNVCAYAVSKINQAIQTVGGPKNLMTMVKVPTMETLESLAQHPKVNLLMGTGGPGLVRSLLKSGKKAIGAGAGNPPVIVDETAIIDKAAKDIITGNSFDNNIVCILEKEVFVIDKVANQLIQSMQSHGAFYLKSDQVEALMNLVLEKHNSDKPVGCSYRQSRYVTKKEWVGQDPYKYLDAIGISYKQKPKNLICETDKDHPFVQLELLMPILPIVRTTNLEQAITYAVEAEHNNKHTAMIHSQNIQNITKFAKAINTTIFVKNAPSLAGIGVNSEGIVSYSIAGPTGEGITTARTFTRKRHCVLVDGFRII